MLIITDYIERNHKETESFFRLISSSFYEIQNLISVWRRSYQWTISWANRIHHTLRIFPFKIQFNTTIGFPNFLFLTGVQTEIFNTVQCSAIQNCSHLLYVAELSRWNGKWYQKLRCDSEAVSLLRSSRWRFSVNRNYLICYIHFWHI